MALIGLMALGVGTIATTGVASADDPKWVEDWRRWEFEKDKDHKDKHDDKFKHDFKRDDDKKHELRFVFDKKDFDKKDFDRKHFDNKVIFVKIIVIQHITVQDTRVFLNVDELIFRAAAVMGLHPQFVWWQLSQGYTLAGLAFQHGIGRPFLIQGLLAFDHDLWPFLNTLVDRTDLLAHTNIRF